MAINHSFAPAVSFSRRIPALLVGAGLALLGVCVLMKVHPPSRSFTQLMAFAACGLGVVWMSLGMLQRGGGFWDMFRLGNNNALVLAGLLAAVEIIGHVAKIDFSKMGGKSAAELRDAYPVCSREPDQPIPEVFFQHPGNLHWRGQPMRTLEVLRKGTDNAYVNEPEISVDYDSQGFRNPEGLKDWDVAVVGDSYTEQGYLPIEQVSSTVMAARAGVRVKNLGTCNTGLLTYARYLQRFGAAPSAKTVVYVMFEGNDVQDTTEEYEALQQFKLTGVRSYRSTGPETSFVKAVTKAVSALRNRSQPQSFQNAWFQPQGAPSLPITISVELPVDPLRATKVQTAAMREGIAACASEARSLGLDALLLYVPVNNRVYHGMLKFGDNLPEEIRTWEPNKLPEFVANVCRENGIAFIDSTPALRAAAEQGHYVHNRILDCHINAEGARIVGEVMADALKSTVKPAQVADHPSALNPK